jgi:CheY-like chemotaxis protein
VARVLVVDDQPDLRFLWRTMLAREGHEVVEVVNGAQALKTIAADPPDVVLLDGHLPDIAGLDVLAFTRAESATRAIPFVIVSGDPSLEDTARKRGLSPDAFLLKPVRAETLSNAIRDVLA